MATVTIATQPTWLGCYSTSLHCRVGLEDPLYNTKLPPAYKYNILKERKQGMFQLKLGQIST
jgi:hypothetical protein